MGSLVDLDSLALHVLAGEVEVLLGDVQSSSGRGVGQYLDEVQLRQVGAGTLESILLDLLLDLRARLARGRIFAIILEEYVVLLLEVGRTVARVQLDQFVLERLVPLVVVFKQLVVQFRNLPLENAKALEGLALEQSLEVPLRCFLLLLVLLFDESPVGRRALEGICLLKHQLCHFPLEMVDLELPLLTFVLKIADLLLPRS